MQTENSVENLRLKETDYTFNTDNQETDDLSVSDNENTQTGSSGDTIWLFIRMILVLVIVIACIYAIVWFLKRSLRPGAENDPYLKKTASITLAPGKTVQIVTLQDKAYLLGVSDSSINLITEIQDKELVDAMNLNAPVSSGKKPADFASLLSSLTGSAKRTERFLKSKREEFSNGEGKR
ncbi:MAG: flagellar biosynthetic protein FliO [Treponemataceae bacterium]|nr:flagellar biosynthetic protein FliO [Treponemataceae bacterium]